MNNEQDDRLEKRLRFVARRYKEGSLDTDKAWERFAARQGIRRKVSFRRYWMAAASVMLLLIGFGTFYMTERNVPEWVSVVTAPGQLKDVYLPDSTLVSMAGGSTLRYDAKVYGKERRVVEMTGRAFFQVKRNEARPFSVHTALTEVTVLGTSFQVNEQPGGTEVNVVTGKVRFTAGEEPEPVVLTAGMSASYSNEKKEIEILTEENPNNLSWKTKQLRFNDTPLEKVIDDLNDYYHVEITNKVDAPDSRLTATFNDLPLDDVLMVINQTLDIRLVPRADKRK
ncbi:FecR domain-containing protein [uncultured Parabacteroides sp.]|uniref:FecR family protein n=1 Tax=uncultured Parabacteroides sp. TaxID=512312 RepID=UPI0025DCA1FF|nr:FecR domain-containing protein [uncultured Parabacteroides sp.]